MNFHISIAEVGIIVALLLVYRLTYVSYWHRQFKAIFGFDPRSGETQTIEKVFNKLSQLRVETAIYDLVYANGLDLVSTLPGEASKLIARLSLRDAIAARSLYRRARRAAIVCNVL